MLIDKISSLHNTVWFRHLTTTLLSDKKFDLKELKPILMKDLESPNLNIESSPPVRIPRKLKEAELDGIHWGSAYVAQRCKDVQVLGAFEKDATDMHVKNEFTSIINRGGLTVPTVDWLKDYRAMEQLFQYHHPPRSLRNERGLFYNFFQMLKAKFPQYHDKVLHLVTRVFSWFRVRSINKLAKKKNRPRKKPKSKKTKNETKKRPSPVTLRGKKHLAERSH